MFFLTKQEKLIVTILATTLLCGSLIQMLFKSYPWLADSVNLLESQKLYPKTDINSATAQELEEIPYIGAYTAQRIIERRQEAGAFKSLDDLKTIPGIKEKNFQKFSPYLAISPRRIWLEDI